MSFNKLNQFDNIPVKMNMNRSKFDLSHDYKTSFNVGKLIPVMCEAVLPDDTWKVSVASVVRSITPAVPVMDNGFLDLFCFWVPNRISTVHVKDWEKICGENTSGYWAPSSESTLVNTGNTFTINSAKAIEVHSLGNYLGLPIGYYSASNNLLNISRLPFNGYWEIWNNWFRDQNTQAPIDWKSFSNSTFASAVAFDPEGQNPGSKLCDVNKLHDYYTSCLPSPAKTTQSVLLPLGYAAPVITGSSQISTSSSTSKLMWKNLSNLNVQNGAIGIDAQGETSVVTGTAPTMGNEIVPSNLWADLSNATAATINDLRQAFAIQRLFEKDARGGWACA